MGVLLQGFFQHNGKGVPSPGDGDVGAPAWWDHLAAQAKELRRAGFSAVWIPPVTKGSSGVQSVGYDVFDDYDIGSKDQKGAVETRYGRRESLQRCAAILRANGLDIYLDLVCHQRGGGNDFHYVYRGAGGAAGKGRFAKGPTDFHPNVPPDPHVVDTSLSDGDDLATINSQPPGHVFHGLIDASDWITRALDLQGYRFDDAKGVSSEFAFPLFMAKSMRGKFVVGEFFDGNAGLISNWVFGQDGNGMHGIASAFDFPLRFTLQAMCNNPGGFPMSSLDGAGFTATAPQNSVTFVENHDTDSQPRGGSPIVINKLLAYAFILTIEGYPSVYYRDYSTDPNCFGLKPEIDTLIWIHEHLAAGGTVQRWKDGNVFAFERLGGEHLLTVLNNDPESSRTITVDTGFGANVRLHDYTGHAGDVNTNANGQATLKIPRNSGDGRSYVCYSRAGITGTFDVVERSVTQEFDGADDLDIAPAMPVPASVSRLWVRPGSPIKAMLKPAVPLTAASNVIVKVFGPTGTVLGQKTYSATTPPGEALEVVAQDKGWHTASIQCTGVTEVPFTLAMTYTASQTPD